MTYLDCSAYDCCHNKGGACCLGCIDVQHTGENGAVCGSYCSNEGYANAATDNAAPAQTADDFVETLLFRMEDPAIHLPAAWYNRICIWCIVLLHG